MPVLRLKLDGEKYTVDPDKLTLGEAEMLEDEFGVEDLTELNFFKSKHLRGLFFTAVKRKYPEMSDIDVMAKVRAGVTGEVFEDLTKQAEEAKKKAEAEEQDPPPAGRSASAPAKDASERKTGPGRQRSRSI